MSNVGLISPTAVEYSIVNKYLLTMAVPLLLFSADLRYAAVTRSSLQASVQVTAALPVTLAIPCFHNQHGRMYATQVCNTGGYLKTPAACLWPSWSDLQPQLLVPWLLSRHCLSETWVWMAGRCTMLSLLYVVDHWTIVITAAAGIPVLHMPATYAADLRVCLCMCLDTAYFLNSSCVTLFLFVLSCTHDGATFCGILYPFPKSRGTPFFLSRAHRVHLAVLRWHCQK